MKTIIAGGRNITDQALVNNAIADSNWPITQIVSGGCRGADKLGESWAKSNSISIRVFPANWNLHGKAAGPIRNRQMAEHADALIAIWDGVSRGTGNMIKTAESLGLSVFIHRV